MSQDNTTAGVDEWDAIEDDGVLDASDTLDDTAGDPLDTGIAAPDRWAAANRFGTTIAEQRSGESLEQLLAEEEPDVEARAGRLVAPDEGSGEDVETDAVGWDAGIDGGGASAEEAAMHVVDDPDGPGEGPLR